MKFKKGDKIVLSSLPTMPNIEPCKELPLVGSEFECIGVVQSVIDSLGVHVVWGNGKTSIIGFSMVALAREEGEI